MSEIQVNGTAMTTAFIRPFVAMITIEYLSVNRQYDMGHIARLNEWMQRKFMVYSPLSLSVCVCQTQMKIFISTASILSLSIVDIINTSPIRFRTNILVSSSSIQFTIKLLLSINHFL